MAGLNTFSVGSGSSSNSKGGIVPSLICECGNVAVVRTVKRGPNVGMKFHGCPLWPVRSLNLLNFVSPKIDEFRVEGE